MQSFMKKVVSSGVSYLNENGCICL